MHVMLYHDDNIASSIFMSKQRLGLGIRFATVSTANTKVLPSAHSEGMRGTRAC